MANQITERNGETLDIVERFSPQDTLNIKGPIVMGFLSIALFGGGIGYWAATAKLESAAIAYGDLSVSSQRQAIQHLEGGIVERLMIQEGDYVEKGQLLIQLSEQQSLSRLESLKGRFVHAVAKESRLKAEFNNTSEIVWESDLEKMAISNTLLEAQQIQKKIFEARARYFESKLNIVHQTISGAKLELNNLKQTKKIERERLSLIEEEILSNQTLVKQGFSGKSTLLQLKRLATEVRSTLSQLDRQTLTVQKRIDENQSRLEEMALERINEVVVELREAQNEIVSIREEYRVAQDIYKRTGIRAPISGKVVNMKVFTEQGVIRSGETLLELVPDDDSLIVEARVSPQDIDLISPGLDARVRLTALNARIQEPLNGKVLTVSADKLSEQNKEDYYLARIALNDQDAQQHQLTAGMNAEVLILSRPRTPISYLLKPITESFNRAFREE
ncbi:HlyD family type I secretion periplasmic adaptor subunit [Vibrio vulnificus]|uniref:Membrane fusion protein (MFP) family protein n=1 Tax=Vibrio vulnificus (strain CMCP6) TaxID=216895 RepID=A0A3Q0L0U1_VIBVU|nr:HlyD family type I secretion periplasmic adaptor subunit [Vibrio vulnificus]AAO08436.1 Membrane-fusion protein [Vibrio vulnificus CMCP6]EHU5197271.1 HlyD family type I secretion periplasmic adaptor subunit [Vibrio vulnificus]EJU9787880.1 HlyD family type I secretion periplasmic adaptor subunit [Vibrio vulnificus]ELE2041998.1 HlyD family type I secretion periplasmic adaptor subunit [Vibrio vulnificus]ELH3006761.1 HlyD family type I secretion periplasmic adaptor subunit [Vibrio vulnificus]